MPIEEKSPPASPVDFPPVRSEMWTARVLQEMEGHAFPDAYAALGIGGMDHFPHPGDDDAPPVAVPLRESGGWELAETVPVAGGDWAAANGRALEALAMGADSLRLLLPASPATAGGLSRLLQDIDPSAASLYLVPEKGEASDYIRLAGAFAEWLGERCATAVGGLEWTPGQAGVDDATVPAFLRDTLHPALPHVRTVSLVREQGLTAGTLVAGYVRLLQDAVMTFHRRRACFPTFDQFSRRTVVTLSVGPDVWMEVAGLRAFRLLWRQLCRAYGSEVVVVPLLDVYLAPTVPAAEADRLVADTVRSVTAVLGGADRLTVLPDTAYRPDSEPGAAERRHARNVQHILRLEAFLDQVADPLAGSHFVERLTENIARLSWDAFRRANS